MPEAGVNMKISNKYRRMAEIYKLFARHWINILSFSEQDLLIMYKHESTGTQINENNGYYVGKKYLNLTVTMWKQDIERGLLFKQELYNDSLFPNWWLDKILD